MNVYYLLEISRCSYASYIKPSPFSGDEQNRHERDKYRDEAIKQIIHVRISDKRGQRNNDKRTDCLQAASNVNWAVAWSTAFQQLVCAASRFIVVVVDRRFTLNVLLLQAFFNIVATLEIERLIKAPKSSAKLVTSRRIGVGKQQEISHKHNFKMSARFSLLTALSINFFSKQDDDDYKNSPIKVFFSDFPVRVSIFC